MAQPAQISAFGSQNYEGADQDDLIRGGGPANRVLSELSLAFVEDDDVAGDDAWSMGRSLRFMAIACGAFWVVAAGALYVLT